MKLKSNKGSSMLLVIIMISVLFILGGAMLSVINMNYKVKSKESNRIQNLYEAEAGLDVAYNIIAKAFDAGVEAGRYEVNKTVTAINERIKKGEKLEDKEIEDMQNNAFKRGFVEYLGKNKESSKVIVDNNIFEQCLNYREDKEDTGISSNNIKYKYVENKVNKNGEDKIFKTIDIKVKEGLNKPRLECEEVTLENDKYSLLVSSQFETKTSTGVNKREVEVTYKIDVPDYESIKSSESNINVEKPSEIESKVIAIDGNMKINGNNTGQEFTITGDVFVKGNENSDKAKDIIVYDKYKGGIEVSGSSCKVTIDGNVATSKTFNVNSNISYVNITNELYAGNIYIGNKDGTHSGQSNINFNDVIIDNDLAVKSDGSDIKINNFYGINDKNTKDEISGKEKKTSSSIIVNNDKNIKSSLTVRNEAYIMGTAFINAKNTKGEYYKTGESVAIKGNYIAYTKPLGDIKSLEFDMYDSLQMIDKVNGTSLNALQKSEYFKAFVENYPDETNGTGGVTLNRKETRAAGAVVYKENNILVVEKSNYTASVQEAINPKKENYAKEVCLLGNLNGLSWSEVYNNQEKYQKTISNSIINFPDNSEVIQTEKAKQKLVLNNNENKTIVLSDSSYKPSSNEELIIVKDKKIDGLIISKGNIKLDGDFEFTGAIIGGGDLEILNRNGSNITHSTDIVNNVINNNYNELNNIFRSSNSSNSSETANGNNLTVNYKYKYDTKKYIKSENWKIRKNNGKK